MSWFEMLMKDGMTKIPVDQPTCSAFGSVSVSEHHLMYIRFKGSDDYLRTKVSLLLHAPCVVDSTYSLKSISLPHLLLYDIVILSRRARDPELVLLVCVEFSSVWAQVERLAPGGEANSLDDFNLLWVAEFKTTHAYEIWERVTDPMLFDIVEPRCVQYCV